MPLHHLFIQRFCALLFAALLAFGPIVGNYAYADQLHESVIASVVGQLEEDCSSHANYPQSTEDNQKSVPVLKQAHCFHAVITGHIQWHVPNFHSPYQPDNSLFMQQSIYPVAIVALSPSVLVHHQVLQHHFVAPQAP